MQKERFFYAIKEKSVFDMEFGSGSGFDAAGFCNRFGASRLCCYGCPGYHRPRQLRGGMLEPHKPGYIFA
jgi:hypothetical protein